MKRLLFALLLALALSARAQPYPSKPIKIIIPFPPGNTTDIMTRLIGPKMAERLGQQIVVENRPGASGMLGLDLVAKSAPDGYTLAAGQGGNMVVLPHTSRNIPYDPLKDFAPIAVTTTNYLGIVANPGAPFRSIGEMVAYARANPGRLTVATNGEGGFPHLAFEHLRTLGGFTFTHIPYKGLGGNRHRHHRRPGAGRHRRHHRHDAAHQVRALAPPRRHQPDARRAVA
jgi:tripartite-type tricarboxylate transporter receptor subunit TctC